MATREQIEDVVFDGNEQPSSYSSGDDAEGVGARGSALVMRHTGQGNVRDFLERLFCLRGWRERQGSSLRSTRFPALPVVGWPRISFVVPTHSVLGIP